MTNFTLLNCSCIFLNCYIILKTMRELPESCENPKYNGRNLTNHVLVQQVDIGENRRKLTYYCPAYLRLQIKNFSQMSFEDLQAAINSVLILTLNFRGITPILQQHIRPMLKLGFNRDDSLQLKQSSKSRAISMNAKEGGIYVYTIHKTIHVGMKQDVFLSPFEMVYLVLSVYIKDIQINSSMVNDVKQQVKLYIQKVTKQKLEKQAEISKLKNSSGDQDELNYLQSELNLIKKKMELFENQRKFLENVDSVVFRFNFMDSDLESLKISYSAQGTYGNYELAERKLNVQYTHFPAAKKVRQEHEKRKKQLESKRNMDINNLFKAQQQRQRRADYSVLKPFNYSHFQIPLYKTPSVTLTTIFFPLWLLVIIMLGIYFQDTGLADRIGSLSGLMIAFVALIPVIRQQLPQSPNVTLVEVLVYMEIFTGILCFIESVSVRNLGKTYDFIWYQNWLFLVSVIILGFQILSIFVLMLIHKLKWEPSYNLDQAGPQVDFNYQKWNNIACDKHFRRKIDNQRVKILKVNKDLERIKQFIDKLQKEQLENLKQLKLISQVGGSIADKLIIKP